MVVELAKVLTMMGKVRRAAQYEVYAHWRRRPLRDTTVFYESFGGNGMLDNPEAIFRALLSDPEFAHFDHVWALTSTRENSTVVREFAKDPRVRFVRPGSVGYYEALATSGYLINNATFLPEFGKRAGQVYLNTWHGTPLKRMGYDIGDPASRVANVIRNFLNADYLLAANPFMAEQMYENAHLLKNIYRGRIIEEGYPRIDRQFVGAPEKRAIREQLEEAGLSIGHRKVILYAPTWKGTNFNRPDDDASELIERVARLNALLDTSRYIVLLKTHQVVHKFVHKRTPVEGFLVPNEIPTNAVLAVTDILVTDYSSIFFDFLASGRPMVFLTPDIGDYADYRGLYLAPGDWPGPVVESVDDLARELKAIDKNGTDPAVAERYRDAQERFTAFEDGHATERVIDIVFRRRESGYRVRPAAHDGRTPILINAGGMRPNGITAALLNLLDAIDHTRFDVSVMFPNSYNRLVVGKQREINPLVRQLARVGGMNGSKVRKLGRVLAKRRGDLSHHRTDPAERQLWDDEWTRCFGSSRFEFVIDYSGYGPLAATLMLHAPGAERSIWLHNDMQADAHRMVRGRRPQLHDLLSVFSLYPEYDHLVSVSPSLAEINSRGLGSYADRQKFTSASNLVNEVRILEAAATDVRVSAADPLTGVVPAWATALTEQATAPVRTFVTVGRLSPEKNHARLIRSFARVHAERPETRLIVIGSGPLQAELDALIIRLRLDDVVWMLGHQSNPYAVMRYADCFVLSSDYEGQPMVVLEALVLGLPVVTVAFGSVEDSLPAGSGLVVDGTDQALADGMLDFLDGKVESVRLDAAAYNRAALGEFYRAVGLTANVDAP
jgi:CDP-glycerol glycerophosphotransferase (TagB/SpsB family)/glycosyltransferase involved in cell wall biosynthesis